jgi:iron complex outermembrane receptor protein
MGAHSAAAQETGAIAGTVIDARSQEPIADINVVVTGTLFGAATEPDGTFRIAGVPPDTYTVQVSALGYRTARRSVEVMAGEAAQLTFRLTPTAEQASATVVDPMSEALIPRAVLEGRPLHEINASDAGQAMRRMAGIGATRRGALGFDPTVRGLSGAQLGVFVDGARAFASGPLRMTAPLSYLDPTMVNQITVVKGPYALTQGGGALSAIRVETRPLDDAPSGTGEIESSFQGNSQAVETAGSIRGALLGASYQIQGAYRTGQNYTDGQGTSIPAQYRSGGVHGRVDVPLTEISRLSVRGAVQDQRDISYPGRTLDATSSTSGYGVVHYRLDRGLGLIRHVEAQVHAAQALHGMNNDAKLTARTFVLPDASIPVQSPGLDITADAELQTAGGRLIARLAPVRGWQWTVGGDAYRAYRDATRSLRLREGGGTGATPPYYTTDEIWPAVTTADVGLFTNATRAVGPVDASGTVRLDWMQSDADRVSAAFLQNAGGLTADALRQSTVHWSGALMLSTALTSQWTLSAGVGSTVRPPDALERYADRFPAGGTSSLAETQGTPTLDPERSTQGDLWVRGTFERVTLQVNGFARRVANYITVTPATIDPLLPFSPETVYRYTNGSATFYGADASGRFVVNPLLTLRGRLSYLWGRDETRDEPAPDVVPFTADIGLRVEAPFSEDLFLDAVTHWATAHDRVARARGERPTDGYGTLDLRLGFAPAERTALILRAENVTDASYTYPLNAQQPFGGGALPEPGRSLGIDLRVRF